MAMDQDIHVTVNLSDLQLSPVSEELIQKYDIPTETHGAVITSDGDLQGGVISRMQSDRYELFVTSPEDVARGVDKMKNLGDDTALFRFNKRNDSYSWIKVRIAS